MFYPGVVRSVRTRQNGDEVLYGSSKDHLCWGQTGIAVRGVAVLKHACLKFVEVDLTVRASVVHEHALAGLDPELGATI